MIAYASTSGNGLSYPKIRAWTADGNGNWGSEVELSSAGSQITNMTLKYSPIENRVVLLTQGMDNGLDAYVCDGNCTVASNWSVTNNLGTVETTTSAIKSDVAFETSTGDALVVYAVNSASGSQDLAYILSATNCRLTYII